MRSRGNVKGPLEEDTVSRGADSTCSRRSPSGFRPRPQIAIPVTRQSGTDAANDTRSRPRDKAGQHRTPWVRERGRDRVLRSEREGESAQGEAVFILNRRRSYFICVARNKKTSGPPQRNPSPTRPRPRHGNCTSRPRPRHRPPQGNGTEKWMINMRCIITRASEQIKITFKTPDT
ncbi:hypothetical protein J6590_039881 [Homalodisca vitripennis]|nr:hypothetical protein J6590_039881 [Homalodisca vitripennis]